jgi:hypothetical protein
MSTFKYWLSNKQNVHQPLLVHLPLFAQIARLNQLSPSFVNTGDQTFDKVIFLDHKQEQFKNNRRYS